MPGVSDKRSKSVPSKPPVYNQQSTGGSHKSQNGKKRKKGKKLKYKKQFVSMASIVSIDPENKTNSDIHKQPSSAFTAENSESNCNIKFIYKPVRQSQSEHSLVSVTKLPQLPKSPSPSVCQSCNTNATPRSSIGCRLPVTLPSGLQPGAHERRKKLPILAAIKPENEKAERERFMRANYNYNPLFVYRFPADSEVLARLGKPSDRYLCQVKQIEFFSIF